MRITELCDLLRIELCTRYTPGAVGPWISNLKRPYGQLSFKESSEDIMVRTCTGWGASPDKSIQDLVRNLNAGDLKLFVIDDSEGTRTTFGIPAEIET